MKKTLLFIVGIVVITLLVFGIAASLTGCKPQPEDAESPAQPKTLNMELVCITPHGHQVYGYQHGFDYIYVVVRHADGIPLGITVSHH